MFWSEGLSPKNIDSLECCSKNIRLAFFLDHVKHIVYVMYAVWIKLPLLALKVIQTSKSYFVSPLWCWHIIKTTSTKCHGHIKGLGVTVLESFPLQHVGTAQYWYYRDDVTDPSADFTSCAFPCCATCAKVPISVYENLSFSVCFSSGWTQMTAGVCVCVCVWVLWVWSLQTAGRPVSPQALGVMTQAGTKGCLEALCLSAGNRPTAAPCTHTMDAQSALINNNCIVCGHAYVSPLRTPHTWCKLVRVGFVGCCYSSVGVKKNIYILYQMYKYLYQKN